jgi:hypothetical protein
LTNSNNKLLNIEVFFSEGLLTDLYYFPLSYADEIEYALQAYEIEYKDGESVLSRVFIADHFDRDTGHLRIPVGMVKWLLMSLKEMKLLTSEQVSIVDSREDKFNYSEIDFKEHISMYDHIDNCDVFLYDHQIDGLRSIFKSHLGIISHPTASGKGEIIVAMSKILQKYGQTAVILPTESSLISTAKRFDRYQVPYCDYHKIRGLEEADSVILSTPKVILNDLNDANKAIPHTIRYLITNEVHHSQASTWRDLAVSLPKLYRCYGLSATPDLSSVTNIRDMTVRESMIRGSHGEVINTIQSKEIKSLISVPDVLDVIYNPPVVKDFHKYLFDWTKVKHYLYKKHRLDFVSRMVNIIDEESQFTTVTFVSVIDKEGDVLYELYPEKTAAWYGGGRVKNKLGLDLDKRTIFDAIENQDIKHIIITSHGREDINLPTLNIALMLELSKKGAIKQCVGRVVRKGTPSFLVNVYDTGPEVIKLQARKRSEIICAEYGAYSRTCRDLEEFKKMIKNFEGRSKQIDLSVIEEHLFHSDSVDGDI